MLSLIGRLLKAMRGPRRRPLGLLLVASAIVPPGALFGYGAYLVYRHGWRNPDHSLGAGSRMMLAMIFLWLIIGLLLAQRQRLRQELEDLGGEYYEYDNQRLRARFDDDDQLWLAAADIALALGKSRRDLHRMLVGFGEHELTVINEQPWLSQAGVERLLSKRSGRHIALLQRYLLGDVFPNHERRRAAYKLHYQRRPFVFNSNLPVKIDDRGRHEGVRVWTFEEQRLRVYRQPDSGPWLAALDLMAVLGKPAHKLASWQAQLSSYDVLLYEAENWLSETGVRALLNKAEVPDGAPLRRFLFGKVFTA
ncbi:hypothetical protein [Chitinimonas sp.]|uniref:hypothetical protein n=1 Tax=Chitinimonas sp. TaxID=1934313 RepID=UPI0035AE444D